MGLGQIPNSWFEPNPCRHCGERNLQTRVIDAVDGDIVVVWCPDCLLARDAWGREWTRTADGGYETAIYE